MSQAQERPRTHEEDVRIIVSAAIATVIRASLTSNQDVQHYFDDFSIWSVEVSRKVIEAKYQITHKLTSETTNLDNPIMTTRMEFDDLSGVPLHAIGEYFESCARAMLSFRVKLARTIITP